MTRKKTTDSWTQLLAAENIQFSPAKVAKQKDTEVKLRVIGAGLPATGTASLKAALEILGFGPVLHNHAGKIDEFTDLIEAKTDQLESQNSKQNRLKGKSSSHPTTDSERYAQAKANLHRLEKESNVSLSDLTQGYASVLGSPIAQFYAELLHIHPNALVILSTCDSDTTWWKSYYPTIGKVVDPGWKGLMWRVFTWPVREDVYVLEERIKELSEVRCGDVGWGEEIHSRHREVVRREVEGRGARLLVWNVEEGWERLCASLGVEVPRREFPRLNDMEEMEAFVEKTFRKATLFWLGVVVAVIWVVFLVVNSDGCEEFWWWWNGLFD